MIVDNALRHRSAMAQIAHSMGKQDLFKMYQVLIDQNLSRNAVSQKSVNRVVKHQYIGKQIRNNSCIFREIERSSQ